MANLQAALEWARNNPDDERSKKLLDAVSNGQITSDSVTARQIQQEHKNPEATAGVFDAVKKGFSNVKESIKKSGEELSNTLNSNVSVLPKVAKTATTLIKGVVNPLAEAAIATPARVIGEVAENVSGIDVNEAVAQGTQKLVQKGMDMDTAKKAMNGWAKLKEIDPESAMALSTILDIGEIASNVVGLKGAQMAGKAGLKGAGKAVEAGAKTAAKGVKTAGEAGQYAVGQTFGLNKETVKNIIKYPEFFTAKEIEKIDRESIFTKVKNAIESRMESLSETGKEYNKIREIPVKTSVSEQTILEKLAEKGIDVKDGKISVNLGSEIQLSKADISGLEEVLSLLSGKDGLTPTEILNLRKRLSNLSGFAEGRTDASSKVAKEIRAVVDDIAKKEIPGLSELDAKFSSEIQFLNKVKGVMFDKKGQLKENAVSKIATLTGKGKEFMLERMEKVVPGITEDINILKAIEDINIAKSDKVGTYGRTAIGIGGGAVAGGPVGAILGAIATSPQVGVALIRSYGKAKGMAKDAIDSIIGKMKSGKKLLDNEKKVIDDAVNSAAKKAGSRVKEMKGKAGLSVQDVSGGKAGYTAETVGEMSGMKRINELAKNIDQADVKVMADFLDVVDKLETYPKVTIDAIKRKAQVLADQMNIKEAIKSDKSIAKVFRAVLDKSGK